MKREYGAADQEQHQYPNNILQHHHKFNLHTPPPPPHLRHPDCPPTSEEADSHSPTHHHHKRSHHVSDNALGFPLPPPPSGSDGATIEVVRRPRGRPPGSKNRPKPPVFITRDSSSSEPSMSPYVLELPPGVDVIESTVRFCRKRGTGLCILNGNGVVANVTLKQPSTTPGATVTFHGQFDILSISATVLPPSAGGGAYPPAAANAPFAISLAGPQGQVVGGLVVGPLVSAGTIYLIAATFNGPSFERLQTAEQEDVGADRDGGHESPQPISGGENGGAALYSYQNTDVVWAPAARQPPSAPPY